MKTLDEVIEVMAKCFDGTYNIVPLEIEPEYGEDALHYLKELQKIEDEYDELKDWFAEQHLENEPLSWRDLQEMIGKPVWIDSVPLVRRWVIIKKFHPIGGNHNLFDMEVEDGAHFLRESMGRDTGAWWQAYRKERK